MENMKMKVNLSRKEAADYLGIGTVALDAYMKRAKNPLPHFRTPGGRKILIPRVALERWNAEEAERATAGR